MTSRKYAHAASESGIHEGREREANATPRQGAATGCWCGHWNCGARKLPGGDNHVESGQTGSGEPGLMTPHFS